MSYRETTYIVDKEVATCVTNGKEEAANEILSQTDFVISAEQ